MKHCLSKFDSEALDAEGIKSKYKDDLNSKCLEAFDTKRAKVKEAANIRCKDLANSVLVQPMLPLIEEASRFAYEIRSHRDGQSENSQEKSRIKIVNLFVKKTL